MRTADRRPRLLCIPGAGSSASRFERIRSEVADLVELRTFELPGRGIRFAEPPLTDISSHVSFFVDKIEAEPYQRWILLGESMGSLTAAWLCRVLTDSPRTDLVGLITVAGAPRVTGRRSRDQLVALLQAEAGRLDGDGPVQMAVDGVLADIDAAHAAGCALQPRPVEIPIATIRGCRDGLIEEQAARRWRDVALGRWSYHEVPGNHYQFEDPTPALMEAIRSALLFITEPESDGGRC